MVSTLINADGRRGLVIILQMFIAVINENFDVAEEAKRSRQAEGFWAKQAPKSQAQAWKRRLNPYRWFAANPKSMTVESLPASLVLPMQKALVQDYQLPKRADAANAVRVYCLVLIWGEADWEYLGSSHGRLGRSIRLVRWRRCADFSRETRLRMRCRWLRFAMRGDLRVGSRILWTKSWNDICLFSPPFHGSNDSPLC